MKCENCTSRRLDLTPKTVNIPNIDKKKEERNIGNIF